LLPTRLRQVGSLHASIQGFQHSNLGETPDMGAPELGISPNEIKLEDKANLLD